MSRRCAACVCCVLKRWVGTCWLAMQLQSSPMQPNAPPPPPLVPLLCPRPSRTTHRHAVVMARGHYFVLNMYTADGQIHNLQHVIAQVTPPWLAGHSLSPNPSLLLRYTRQLYPVSSYYTFAPGPPPILQVLQLTLGHWVGSLQWSLRCGKLLAPFFSSWYCIQATGAGSGYS